MAELIGLSRPTIQKGIKELRAGIAPEIVMNDTQERPGLQGRRSGCCHPPA
jgi:hypothetical protein